MTHRKTHYGRSAALAASVSILAAGPWVARAQLVYTVTDLGTLGGPQARGTAMNASAVAVGESTLASGAAAGFVHAFKYGASMTDVTASAARDTHATAISSQTTPTVVGWLRTPAGADHAFRTDPSGNVIDMGTLPNGGWSRAHGINGSGRVVGVSASGRVRRAFRTDANGQLVDLGTLGGFWSWALGINDNGQVVGASAPLRVDVYHAYRTARDDPNATIAAADDLETRTETSSVTYRSYASAINSSGQVVGAFDHDAAPHGDHMHAFRTAAGGKLDTATNLGTLPGGLASHATAINCHGGVVGTATVDEGSWHAFVYEGSGPMHDLNSLANVPTGWVLTEAVAINDSGHILANARNGTRMHAFLLTRLSALPPCASAWRSGGLPAPTYALLSPIEQRGRFRWHLERWADSPGECSNAAARIGVLGLDWSWVDAR